VSDERTPFADLPALLVDEVLEKATRVGDVLSEDLRALREQRSHYRDALQGKGLILHESSLGFATQPTTCGIDGSYAIERLLTADLAVAASVARGRAYASFREAALERIPTHLDLCCSREAPGRTIPTTHSPGNNAGAVSSSWPLTHTHDVVMLDGL
jgi:hypothetical protein